MIQVARLNLRMQKELKLLHYDPPPGVSSVRLADDQTLTNINAQIHGPEGTVYALGLFHIKILIPERYPFHPPNVTFTTPIYHPNIDDGGRICLDILNLPPKGAWQPSLNISTVLTSIGLLLSEPNPDDGLKCEASREYKYSRPAFDQKARSWTQKYAKPGNNSGGIAEAYPPALVQPIVELENAAVERILGTSGKEMTGGRKLSLGSTPRSDVKSNSNGKENKLPTGCVSTSLSHRLSLTHSQIMPGSFSEPLRLLHGSGREGANGELPEGTIAESDVKKAEAGESPTPMQQQLKVVVEQKVSTIIVPDSESDDEGPTKLRRLSLKRIRSEGKRKAIVPPD